MSRRTALGVGLAGTCGVLLGSAGLAMQESSLWPVPEGGLATLSHAEYSVLAAVADRICPALGPGAPGATGLGIARLVDAELAKVDPELTGQVKLALSLLESGLVGAVFGERWRPFTQLGAAEQDAALEAWRSSEIAARRAAYRALRSMIGAVYFSLPETWHRIGYPGPPATSAMRAGYTQNLVDLDSLLAPST